MRCLRWIIAACAALALVPGAAFAATGDWRVGYAEPPDSLNPLVMQASSSLTIAGMAYENLIAYSIEDLSPDLERSLAKSYRVSDDGLTWTFKLNAGVKWSDGQPFTADDVVFTYETILANPASPMGFATAGLERVSAPDDLTVVLKTSKPNAVIGSVPMLPKHVWSRLSAKEIGKGPGPLPAVTTGPYSITSFDPRGDTVLTSNPHYRFSPPNPKRVVWIKYGDQPGLLRDIRLGQLDAVSGGKPDWVDILRGNKDVRVWSALTPNLTMIGFNSCPPGGAGNCEGPGPDTNVKVVQDPAIRKAVNLAIDRQQIVDLVYSGQATAGVTGMIPPFYATYEPETFASPEPDVEGARAALDEGGWDCSENPCVKDGVKAEFKLLYDPADTINAALVQRLRAQLDPVGIKLELAPQEFNAQLASVNAPGSREGTFRPNYDAIVSGWTGLASSPDILMSLLQTSTIFAEVYYSNPAYDRLLQKGLNTVDVAKRADAFRQANQIAEEDLPYVTIVNGRSTSLTRNDTWHNYQPSLDGEGSPWGVSPQQVADLEPGPGDDAGGSGSDDDGGSGGLVIGIVVAVVVLGGGALLLMRRRGGSKGGSDTSGWTEA